MSKGLGLIGLLPILCFVLPACADGTKSVDHSTSGKPTLADDRSSSSPAPLYVGVIEGSKLVPGWMKELSLSEAQFSVCWQYRAPHKSSWVVLDWSWVEDKKFWKILDQSAKGAPDHFVSCVKSEFGRWLSGREVKRAKGGTFYLVETKEQLGGRGWPEGADRYKWVGRSQGSQDKKLRVYQ